MSGGLPSPGQVCGSTTRLPSRPEEGPFRGPGVLSAGRKTQTKEAKEVAPPERDFVGPRLSVRQRAHPRPARACILFLSPFTSQQSLKKLELKSTEHKRRGGGAGMEESQRLSELEANIIFTTSQLATEWISTFLSFASERSSRNLVAISPQGPGSLNQLLLPPHPTPNPTSPRRKVLTTKNRKRRGAGVNATDVTE